MILHISLSKQVVPFDNEDLHPHLPAWAEWAEERLGELVGGQVTVTPKSDHTNHGFRFGGDSGEEDAVRARWAVMALPHLWVNWHVQGRPLSARSREREAARLAGALMVVTREKPAQQSGPAQQGVAEIEGVAPTPAPERCRLCGARSDALGVYETCIFNGPLHDWGPLT